MIDKLSWITIYPEVILLAMASVIAILDLGVSSPRRTATYLLTVITLVVVAGMQAMYADSGQTFYGFNGMVVSDPMGNWLKCFASLALMVTLVYGRPYAADRDMLRGGEETPVFCQRVNQFENDADGITREVLTAVRRTFITPTAVRSGDSSQLNTRRLY